LSRRPDKRDSFYLQSDQFHLSITRGVLSVDIEQASASIDALTRQGEGRCLVEPQMSRNYAERRTVFG
jgi:hypothetical protein